jgi:hypothetical protein
MRTGPGMVSDTEVRERLASFLRNELSLDEFEDWLVEHSWNMHRDSAPDVQDLVSSIELSLFEYSNGHRSEAELRSDLMSFLDHIVITLQITVERVVPRRLPRYGANLFQVDVAPLALLPAQP